MMERGQLLLSKMDTQTEKGCFKTATLFKIYKAIKHTKNATNRAPI